MSTDFYQPYEGCPLCSWKKSTHVLDAPLEGHPLYAPNWMKPALTWLQCEACFHVFTQEHFTEAGYEKLFEGRAKVPERPENRTPRDRLVACQLVEKVQTFTGFAKYHRLLRWLDVGFGNGAVVAAAKEFGFDAWGLDSREDSCAQLCNQGYRAIKGSIVSYTPPEDERLFNVVSMLDVLEHVPFPKAVLERVREEFLVDRGILFLSMPNTESDEWRMLEADRSKNNYWQEVEHHHNFARSTLVDLIEDVGFEPLAYSASLRYKAGMEIIARRV